MNGTGFHQIPESWKSSIFAEGEDRRSNSQLSGIWWNPVPFMRKCRCRRKCKHFNRFYVQDPQTQKHTNNIEASWRTAKSIVSTSGRRKSHIPGNLAKYLFNKRCLQFDLDRTTHFYELAGSLYDPTAPVMDEQEVDILPQTEIDFEDLEGESDEWFFVFAVLINLFVILI